jgi:hypothetical protein
MRVPASPPKPAVPRGPPGPGLGRIIGGVILSRAVCHVRGHRWRRVRRAGTHVLVCMRCNSLSTVAAQGHPEDFYPFTDAPSEDI